MLSRFAGWAGNPPWEKGRISRSCDHLLWASTGEAETGKSGVAEAAADQTLCKLGTGEVVGASCKGLSAENTESLPAFEGLVPCRMSGLLPVRSFKEVKHSAAALLSAYCTRALLCPTSARRTCPPFLALFQASNYFFSFLPFFCFFFKFLLFIFI